MHNSEKCIIQEKNLNLRFSAAESEPTWEKFDYDFAQSIRAQ